MITVPESGYFSYAEPLCGIRKKSQRTNSTFGFLPTHRQTLKKPKELFFIQRSDRNDRIKSNFENE